jgi:hypothetical protein
MIALTPGMWRSASRRTPQHSRSRSSRDSVKLNCAQAVCASGDSLDDIAGAGDKRIYLRKGKRRGGVRDRENLSPALLFNGIPAVRWLG